MLAPENVMPLTKKRDSRLRHLSGFIDSFIALALNQFKLELSPSRMAASHVAQHDRGQQGGGTQPGQRPDPGCYTTATQGLTLVHFSAQRENFPWDRGLLRGCLSGVRGY